MLRSIGKLWEDTGSGEQEVIIEHESLLASAATVETSLYKRPRRPILLVGESGVGKTTLLKVLGRRLSEQGWLIFEAGAKEILAGQIYMGELEQRLKTLLEQISGDRKVLWVVPDLHHLLWAGRHKHSPSRVLELLLPAVESGEIVTAAEVTPEAFEVLVQNIPRIRSAFDNFHVVSSSDAETQDLAKEWLERFSSSSMVPCTFTQAPKNCCGKLSSSPDSTSATSRRRETSCAC